MGENYFSGITSHSFFYLFHFSLKWKGFRRSWFHLQAMILVLLKIVLVFQNQLVITPHLQVIIRWYMKMFVNMDRQRQCAFAYAIVANSSNMFNANELKEGTCHSLDSSVGIWDVLVIMQTTLGLFKIWTNFVFAEFDKLALLVKHTIGHCARFTNEHHVQVLNLRFGLWF